MNNVRHMRRTIGRQGQGGFTLIEVMIAVLVLGVGLLGLALLQTMNVRFVQSANYRTQATNLGYEVLDQVRANRISKAAYAGNYAALTADADCVAPTGANVTPALFRKALQCRIGKVLGADGTAAVVVNGDVVTVTMTWDDERWRVGGNDGQVVLRSQL